MENKGQSLFEIVFAVGIVALVLIGVVSLATTSVRNTSFSQNKTKATKLTQEATEWLRGQRDSGGWDEFVKHSDIEANFGNTTSLGKLNWDDGSIEVPDTPFERKVLLVTLDPPNTIEATVTVSWVDGQGEHSVKAITRYTDWIRRL